MAIHWKIPFKSITGTAYTLNVYDATYSGSAVTLTAAATPFVTNEDNSTDILEPVRISTGTINIINRGDLAGLLPSTPKARRVTLTSGNDILWQGYIKQQQMTQPWAQTPYELQLPVVSALGILDNKIEKGDVPYRARIAEYLRLAIAATGATYTNIVYPADLKLDADGTWDVFFRLGLQDRNWFSYKNENVLDPDESRYDGMTWIDILTELMRAFGYTLYEYGTTLYIIGRRGMLHNSITIADLEELAENGETTPTTITSQAVAISSLQIGGTDGTIDVMEAKRRAIVESQINPFNDDSLPVMNTLYLDYVATIDVQKQGYQVAGWYYYDKKLGLYEPKQDSNVWTFRQFNNGSEVAWDAQDITRDYNMAVYCRDSEGNDQIVINYDSIGDAWSNGWVCSVKSPSQSFFAGGYISLHLGVEFYEGVGGSAPETRRAKFMLRLGSYYYNATTHAWTTTPAQFDTQIEDGLIVPPSSYESGDNNTLVFKIPDGGIYGDVELFIYNPYSTAATQQGHQAVYEISKMDMRYVDYETDNFKDEYITDTNRFVVPLNTFARDDDERRTALSSFINHRMGYGVMMAPDFSSPQGKLVDRYAGEVYLEESLVRLATTCYENAQQILTIPLRHTSHLAPTDSYTWHSDTYHYLSVVRNWADDLQYLQIFKTL